MNQSKTEQKLKELERRIVKLESLFDLKPVEIGKEYKKEFPKAEIMPCSQETESNGFIPSLPSDLSLDTNCPQEVKKEESLPLDKPLEAQNIVGEENTQRNMPIDVDNQSIVDTIKKPKGRPPKQ